MDIHRLAENCDGSHFSQCVLIKVRVAAHDDDRNARAGRMFPQTLQHELAAAAGKVHVEENEGGLLTAGHAHSQRAIAGLDGPIPGLAQHRRDPKATVLMIFHHEYFMAFHDESGDEANCGPVIMVIIFPDGIIANLISFDGTGT